MDLIKRTGYPRIKRILIIIISLDVMIVLAGALFIKLFSIGVEIFLFGCFSLFLATEVFLYLNIRTHLDIIERQQASIQSAISLNRVKVNHPIFLSRHSVSPDLIEIIYELTRRRKIENILEIGSGATSLYIAALIVDRNFGKLISLEQDKHWAELINRELEEIVLPNQSNVNAQIRHAPLLYNDLTQSQYYDVASSLKEDDGTFDLIIIDGPGDINLRKAGFKLLNKYMSSSCFLLMDDGDRDKIRRSVMNFAKSNKWKFRYYPTVKGTWLLWRHEDFENLPLP